MFDCQLKLINEMKFVNINSGWIPNNGNKYFVQKISHAFNNQYNNCVDFFTRVAFFRISGNQT